MSERYHPASDFLKAIAADEVALVGSDFALANLRRLIEMTRDEDRSNRDWATLLLSQQEIDTPDVREALLFAAHDEDMDVRAEALLGLAQRDKAIALPFAVIALSAERASMSVFEAAALIADRSLVELLRPWTEPSDDKYLDELAREALAACEARP
jgi:hypothetical protein